MIDEDEKERVRRRLTHEVALLQDELEKLQTRRKALAQAEDPSIQQDLFLKRQLDTREKVLNERKEELDAALADTADAKEKRKPEIEAAAKRAVNAAIADALTTLDERVQRAVAAALAKAKVPVGKHKIARGKAR